MPETPSPRLSLPAPSGTDSADVPAAIKSLRDVLDLVAVGYAQGSASSRPTTAAAGRLHYATDTSVLSYQTGSGWVDVAGGAEAARVVGAANQPAFGSGWVTSTGGAAPARFWRQAGRVFLAGAFSGGGSSAPAVFTLPTGYRPRYVTCFAIPNTQVAGAVSHLSIGIDGAVTVSPGAAGYYWLDGITFDVAR